MVARKGAKPVVPEKPQPHRPAVSLKISSNHPSMIDQIGHFFEHYKDLEKDKWVKIVRWGEAEEGHQFIRDAMDRDKD